MRHDARAPDPTSLKTGEQRKNVVEASLSSRKEIEFLRHINLLWTSERIDPSALETLADRTRSDKVEIDEIQRLKSRVCKGYLSTYLIWTLW
jgi:hypothetical protein